MAAKLVLLMSAQTTGKTAPGPVAVPQPTRPRPTRPPAAATAPNAAFRHAPQVPATAAAHSLQTAGGPQPAMVAELQTPHSPACQIAANHDDKTTDHHDTPANPADYPLPLPSRRCQLESRSQSHSVASAEVIALHYLPAADASPEVMQPRLSVRAGQVAPHRTTRGHAHHQEHHSLLPPNSTPRHQTPGPLSEPVEPPQVSLQPGKHECGLPESKEPQSCRHPPSDCQLAITSQTRL